MDYLPKQLTNEEMFANANMVSKTILLGIKFLKLSLMHRCLEKRKI